MRAIVFGATGLVGNLIIKHPLLENYEKVYLISRRTYKLIHYIGVAFNFR